MSKRNIIKHSKQKLRVCISDRFIEDVVLFENISFTFTPVVEVKIVVVQVQVNFLFKISKMVWLKIFENKLDEQ